MCDYTLAFDRLWALAFLPLALLLILLPYFMTPRNKRGTPGRIISLLLQVLAACLAVFMLTGVSMVETNITPENTSMVIVVDASHSVTSTESSETQSTLQEKMEEYLAELVNEADDHTQIAVVVFAGNGVVVSDFTTQASKTLSDYYDANAKMADTDFKATNISDALKCAAELFANDNEDAKRVILLSDGRQTSGNAWDAADILLQRDIRLDAVSFSVTGEEYAEVSIMDFEIAPSHVIDQGKSVTLNVKYYSTQEGEGTLIFYDGEKSIGTYPVRIDKGDNKYSQIFVGKINEVGLHELRVELVPGKKPEEFKDSVAENNAMTTWVKVQGDAKVLVVDGDGSQASSITTQLEVLYDTTVKRPSDFPKTMAELLEYDEIILMNTTLNQLPEGADSHIHTFVSVLGRGLLTTTGNDELTYSSYGGSKLADLLPVTITLDETETNVAIVIVLDTSASMRSGVDKFSSAQEGAKACVGVLEDTDYVAFVTFDADAEVHQQLTKVEDKNVLYDVIDELKADGSGTNYSTGLNAAYDLLVHFKDAKNKHVIFLSDGEPTDRNYAGIPTSMRNHGITLSTISICAGSSAKNKLSTMAENGGGIFRSVDTAEDLPNLSNIMEELTEMAKKPQFVNTEPFVPMVSDSTTGLLSGVSVNELTIGGYIGSTTKPDASLTLYNDDLRPVVAEWQYGNGYVVTVMTNLAGTWCQDLFEEQSGVQLITNLLAQSLHDEKQHSALDVRVEQDGQTARIRVQTPMDYYDQEVTVGVLYPDGTEEELLLSKTGRGVYSGLFVMDEPEYVHYLDVSLHTADGDLMDHCRLAHSSGVIAEYDIFGFDGENLLESITSSANGEVMETTEQLLSVVQENKVDIVTNGLVPMASALLVLMLLSFLFRLMTFGQKTSTLPQKGSDKSSFLS